MSERRALNWIGGEWTDSPVRTQSFDPATGDVIGTYANTYADGHADAAAKMRRDGSERCTCRLAPGRPSRHMAEAASGGRTWWTHFEFTRINTTPTFLRKKIEDLRILRAFTNREACCQSPACGERSLSHQPCPS